MATETERNRAERAALWATHAVPLAERSIQQSVTRKQYEADTKDFFETDNKLSSYAETAATRRLSGTDGGALTMYKDLFHKYYASTFNTVANSSYNKLMKSEFVPEESKTWVNDRIKTIQESYNGIFKDSEDTIKPLSKEEGTDASRYRKYFVEYNVAKGDNMLGADIEMPSKFQITKYDPESNTYKFDASDTLSDRQDISKYLASVAAVAYRRSKNTDKEFNDVFDAHRLTNMSIGDSLSSLGGALVGDGTAQGFSFRAGQAGYLYRKICEAFSDTSYDELTPDSQGTYNTLMTIFGDKRPVISAGQGLLDAAQKGSGIMPAAGRFIASTGEASANTASALGRTASSAFLMGALAAPEILPRVLFNFAGYAGHELFGLNYSPAEISRYSVGDAEAAVANSVAGITGVDQQALTNDIKKAVDAAVSEGEVVGEDRLHAIALQLYGAHGLAKTGGLDTTDAKDIKAAEALSAEKNAGLKLIGYNDATTQEETKYQQALTSEYYSSDPNFALLQDAVNQEYAGLMKKKTGTVKVAGQELGLHHTALEETSAFMGRVATETILAGGIIKGVETVGSAVLGGTSIGTKASSAVKALNFDKYYRGLGGRVAGDAAVMAKNQPTIAAELSTARKLSGQIEAMTKNAGNMSYPIHKEILASKAGLAKEAYARSSEAAAEGIVKQLGLARRTAEKGVVFMRDTAKLWVLDQSHRYDEDRMPLDEWMLMGALFHFGNAATAGAVKEATGIARAERVQLKGYQDFLNKAMLASQDKDAAANAAVVRTIAPNEVVLPQETITNVTELIPDKKEQEVAIAYIQAMHQMRDIFTNAGLNPKDLLVSEDSLKKQLATLSLDETSATAIDSAISTITQLSKVKDDTSVKEVNAQYDAVKAVIAALGGTSVAIEDAPIKFGQRMTNNIAQSRETFLNDLQLFIDDFQEGVAIRNRLRWKEASKQLADAIALRPEAHLLELQQQIREYITAQTREALHKVSKKAANSSADAAKELYAALETHVEQLYIGPQSAMLLDVVSILAEKLNREIPLVFYDAEGKARNSSIKPGEPVDLGNISYVQVADASTLTMEQAIKVVSNLVEGKELTEADFVAALISTLKPTNGEPIADTFLKEQTVAALIYYMADKRNARLAPEIKKVMEGTLTITDYHAAIAELLRAVRQQEAPVEEIAAAIAEDPEVLAMSTRVAQLTELEHTILELLEEGSPVYQYFNGIDIDALKEILVSPEYRAERLAQEQAALWENYVNEREAEKAADAAAADERALARKADLIWQAFQDYADMYNFIDYDYSTATDVATAIATTIRKDVAKTTDVLLGKLYNVDMGQDKVGQLIDRIAAGEYPTETELVEAVLPNIDSEHTKKLIQAPEGDALYDYIAEDAFIRNLSEGDVYLVQTYRGQNIGGEVPLLALAEVVTSGSKNSGSLQLKITPLHADIAEKQEAKYSSLVSHDNIMGVIDTKQLQKMLDAVANEGANAVVIAENLITKPNNQNAYKTYYVIYEPRIVDNALVGKAEILEGSKAKVFGDNELKEVSVPLTSLVNANVLKTKDSITSIEDRPIIRSYQLYINKWNIADSREVDPIAKRMADKAYVTEAFSKFAVTSSKTDNVIKAVRFTPDELPAFEKALEGELAAQAAWLVKEADPAIKAIFGKAKPSTSAIVAYAKDRAKYLISHPKGLALREVAVGKTIINVNKRSEKLSTTNAYRLLHRFDATNTADMTQLGKLKGSAEEASKKFQEFRATLAERGTEESPILISRKEADGKTIYVAEGKDFTALQQIGKTLLGTQDATSFNVPVHPLLLAANIYVKADKSSKLINNAMPLTGLQITNGRLTGLYTYNATTKMHEATIVDMVGAKQQFRLDMPLGKARGKKLAKTSVKDAPTAAKVARVIENNAKHVGYNRLEAVAYGALKIIKDPLVKFGQWVREMYSTFGKNNISDGRALFREAGKWSTALGDTETFASWFTRMDAPSLLDLEQGVRNLEWAEEIAAYIETPVEDIMVLDTSAKALSKLDNAELKATLEYLTLCADYSGLEIVPYVRTKGMSSDTKINGVCYMEDGIIFLDSRAITDSGLIISPFMRILGHEIFHGFEQTPEGQLFVDTVRKATKADKALRSKFKQDWSGLTIKDGLAYELGADFWGYLTTKAYFWEAMARYAPDLTIKALNLIKMSTNERIEHSMNGGYASISERQYMVDKFFREQQLAAQQILQAGKLVGNTMLTSAAKDVSQNIANNIKASARGVAIQRNLFEALSDRFSLKVSMASMLEKVGVRLEGTSGMLDDAAAKTNLQRGAIIKALEGTLTELRSALDTNIYVKFNDNLILESIFYSELGVGNKLTELRTELAQYEAQATATIADQVGRKHNLSAVVVKARVRELQEELNSLGKDYETEVQNQLSQRKVFGYSKADVDAKVSAWKADKFKNDAKYALLRDYRKEEQDALAVVSLKHKELEPQIAVLERQHMFLKAATEQPRLALYALENELSRQKFMRAMPGAEQLLGYYDAARGYVNFNYFLNDTPEMADAFRTYVVGAEARGDRNARDMFLKIVEPLKNATERDYRDFMSYIVIKNELHALTHSKKNSGGSFTTKQYQELVESTKERTNGAVDLGEHTSATAMLEAWVAWANSSNGLSADVKNALNQHKAVMDQNLKQLLELGALKEGETFYSIKKAVGDYYFHQAIMDNYQHAKNSGFFQNAKSRFNTGLTTNMPDLRDIVTSRTGANISYTKQYGTIMADYLAKVQVAYQLGRGLSALTDCFDGRYKLQVDYYNYERMLREYERTLESQPGYRKLVTDAELGVEGAVEKLAEARGEYYSTLTTKMALLEADYESVRKYMKHTNFELTRGNTSRSNSMPLIINGEVYRAWTAPITVYTAANPLVAESSRVYMDLVMGMLDKEGLTAGLEEFKVALTEDGPIADRLRTILFPNGFTSKEDLGVVVDAAVELVNKNMPEAFSLEQANEIIKTLLNGDFGEDKPLYQIRAASPILFIPEKLGSQLDTYFQARTPGPLYKGMVKYTSWLRSMLLFACAPIPYVLNNYLGDTLTMAMESPGAIADYDAMMRGFALTTRRQPFKNKSLGKISDEEFKQLDMLKFSKQEFKTLFGYSKEAIGSFEEAAERQLAWRTFYELLKDGNFDITDSGVAISLTALASNMDVAHSDYYSVHGMYAPSKRLNYVARSTEGMSKLDKAKFLMGESWDNWKNAISLRERAEKIALLEYQLKRIAKGKPVAVTDNPKILRLNPLRQAGAATNYIRTDYSAVSPFHQTVREVFMPFSTWYYQNTAHGLRWLVNNSKQLFSKRGIPALGKLALTLGLFGLAPYLWNHSDADKEAIEMKLDTTYRLLPHFIVTDKDMLGVLGADNSYGVVTFQHPLYVTAFNMTGINYVGMITGDWLANSNESLPWNDKEWVKGISKLGIISPQKLAQNPLARPHMQQMNAPFQFLYEEATGERIWSGQPVQYGLPTSQMDENAGVAYRFAAKMVPIIGNYMDADWSPSPARGIGAFTGIGVEDPKFWLAKTYDLDKLDTSYAYRTIADESTINDMYRERARAQVVQAILENMPAEDIQQELQDEYVAPGYITQKQVDTITKDTKTLKSAVAEARNEWWLSDAEEAELDKLYTLLQGVSADETFAEQNRATQQGVANVYAQYDLQQPTYTKEYKNFLKQGHTERVGQLLNSFYNR